MTVNLYDACKEGNLTKVKEILNDDSTKVDFGSRYTENRSTLLHVTVWHKHNKVLAFLLETGFDSIINESDTVEDTALHVSAIRGNKEACKQLLKAGADVSLVNQIGNTAFHDACKQRDSEICNLLLKACRDEKLLDLKNKAGDTPFQIAVRQDSLDVVQLLLEEEVNFLVKDGEGNNILHIAALRSSPELFQTLITKDHGKRLLSEPNDKDNTPLHIAAERMEPKICDLLLENGCKVDFTNEQGNTALHITAKSSGEKNRDIAFEICKKLLDKNAEWNRTNNNIDTPLHQAARNANVKICELLLEKGADCLVLQENKASQKPMDLVPASKVHKMDALNDLTHKAAFNELNKTGNTPVKQVKLFLCGEPAVGKTTLYKAITKGRLSSWLPGRRECHHIATPGVNVKAKRIRQVGDFVIWDMAGQIEYHVTHAMLLGSSTGVFIVVFDMRWPIERKKSKLMYWLSFIKAGHKVGNDGLKTPVIVVGTHEDLLNKDEKNDEYERTQETLDGIIKLFEPFLVIHNELMMIKANRPRSKSVRKLKKVIKEVAKPLKERGTPKICADVSKHMAKWTKKKSELPIMTFQEFVQLVNREVAPLANESTVKLVLGYLNDIGELHHAKVRQTEIDSAADTGINANNDMIILNPNWLTTTIFGPIFAKPDFRADYRGIPEQQLYTLEDLKTHFRKIKDPGVLVELLVYFELAFKKDDTSFILPVKLPADVHKIDWENHDEFASIIGIRIECRDETDMFTSDTFPCSQVRAMNRYKDSGVRPMLSHRGLKIFKNVEGMIQLTKDKRAIHLAVRMKEDQKSAGKQQLRDMEEMVFFELKERSIGTQVNRLYLSPIDLKNSTDLEENVSGYKEVDILGKDANESLAHPKRVRPETVADVTGLLEQKEILANIKPLSQTDFAMNTSGVNDHKLLTDDESLLDLAEKIGDSDREALGHHLGFKNAEIYSIKSDYETPNIQTFQILLRWRQAKGRNLSTEELDELRRALVRIKRNDLAYGVSDSAASLSDDMLESIVQRLDKRQWQYLAMKLKCPAEEVYGQEETALVFIRWRRQQPRNVNVIKYFAAGLRSVERNSLAEQVEQLADQDNSEHKTAHQTMRDDVELSNPNPHKVKKSEPA